MLRHGNDRMLSRLSRALRASLFCACFASVGCAHHGGVAPSVCPEPSWAEEASWGDVVDSGEYEPAVRWLGRIIAKCWPDLADEVRREP